jgi:prepilin-type N-terminal cleavage/methylation domain-containing protein
MKRPFHRSIRGFTLVEIMLVVAIIALLVAIAVPNF